MIAPNWKTGKIVGMTFRQNAPVMRASLSRHDENFVLSMQAGSPSVHKPPRILGCVSASFRLERLHEQHLRQ
jgi:hypothetical protein